MLEEKKTSTSTERDVFRFHLIGGTRGHLGLEQGRMTLACSCHETSRDRSGIFDQCNIQSCPANGDHLTGSSESMLKISSIQRMLILLRPDESKKAIPFTHRELQVIITG